MYSQVIQEINPPDSILFLGAGFLQSAENICGESVPLSNELRKKLANCLGVDGNKYDLKILADEFHSRSGFDLYQTLYECFTINKISEHRNDILRLGWKRIYTTNYDDIVEHSYLQNNNHPTSYTFRDEIPRKLADGSIIHLYRVIHNANKENI